MANQTIDPDDIAHQRSLFDIHRRNLKRLEEQRAQYGIAVPIDLMNSINLERSAIRDSILALRELGVISDTKPSFTSGVKNNQPISATGPTQPSAQEDGKIASAGFTALQELSLHPEVRAELNLLRADLRAAHRQITLITAYKNLHDHFQKLEACYNTIHHFI